MKFWPIGLLMFTLAACASGGSIADDSNTKDEVPSPAPMELPNLGSAPELTNEVWLNTDEPLRLANLLGKVVLLDMWTFG